MAYTRDWIDRNFLDAMRELEARKRVQIVVKDDCSIM